MPARRSPAAGGALGPIRQAARDTPPERERHADLMRAVAIGFVVLGHWLVVLVTYDDVTGLAGRSALGVVGWMVPLTWLFQVMPVFFLVGGYANAASWRSHRSRGGSSPDWLLGRFRRLLRPTTVFLAVVAGAALLARTVGTEDRLVGTATWLVTMPLWFLVVYLAVVALTPVTHRLHVRFGLAVPLALAAPVGLADLLGLGLGLPYVDGSSYLLAWLAVHQLGYAWQDGSLLARRGVAVTMAVVGALALVLLTVLGPYPVSMVAVPGETVQNTAPPTLALLALAVTQTGVVLLLRRPADRWLARSERTWTAVVAVNAVVLTVFLWHMAAVVVSAVLLVPTGLIPQPSPGSGEWLAWRVPGLAALTLVLTALVLLFARVEIAARAAAPPRGGRSRWPLTVLGLVAVVAGLLTITLSGRGVHGPAGLPTGALLLYGSGVVALASAARASRDGDGAVI